MSANTITYLVSLVLVVVSAQNARRFHPCQRNQPADQLNECVRNSLQKAIPELVKGLPEYGLTSIDPLRVESIVIPKGNGKINVDLKFNNLDIIGLRNAKITSVKMDVDKYRMSAKVEISEGIMLQGDYTVKGQVLVLPVEGSGRCNITLTNVKGEITELQAKSVNRKGTEYTDVTSFKFVVNDVDMAHYDFQNLFNGNKKLGDNLNLVLNDNWKDVFVEMKAPIQSALKVAFRSIVHNIITELPYNKIFP